VVVALGVGAAVVVVAFVVGQLSGGELARGSAASRGFVAGTDDAVRVVVAWVLCQNGLTGALVERSRSVTPARTCLNSALT